MISAKIMMTALLFALVFLVAIGMSKHQYADRPKLSAFLVIGAVFSLALWFVSAIISIWQM